MTSIFGRVLEVCAGQAAPMDVQGERIVTGFDKGPVSGRVRVARDGLDIDEHVDDALDRDRAVLLYQRCHYDAWDRELGRELAPGTFGENLTIDAVEDMGIALGAELRVGSALLRVTQPRIPCRKMAVRLNESADFPARYLRSGRLGFFCAVLEPGEIGAGDEIALVSEGRTDLTVADMARILYLDGRDRHDLRRLIGVPELPETWRGKTRQALDRLTALETDWPGLRPLGVTKTAREATDVLSIELEDPAGDELPAFEAGQFLPVAVEAEPGAPAAERNYTIVGRSRTGRGYRIAVKRETAPSHASDVPDGLVSGYIHRALRAGSTVAARSPRGVFVVEPGARPVVLVSAGIGVTPMFAMLERLVREGAARDIYFLHCTRNSEHHVFGPAIRDLAAVDSRVHVHVSYTRPLPGDVLGEHYDERGRLSFDRIRRVVPSLVADFYVCGPRQFMDEVVTGLKENEVPSERIKFEYFGAAPPMDAGALGDEVIGADGRPLTVTFGRSGIVAPWRENAFSILALAEHMGLRPAASCRSGLCSTCACTVPSGDIEYVIEPMQAPPDEHALLCCSRPLTSITVDL